jgi:Na+/proline symporter
VFALLVVVGLFGYAAVTHEAKKSGGLDQALLTVLKQPFGPVLLALIAAGIVCYGLFCFVRARHLDS